MEDSNVGQFYLAAFLVLGQLYTQPCVCVSVPRFVCPQNIHSATQLQLDNRQQLLKIVKKYKYIKVMEFLHSKNLKILCLSLNT